MDEKLLVELFGNMLDERFKKFETNIKDYIVKNNVSISEVITISLEDTEDKLTAMQAQTQEQIEDILHQVGDFHTELQKLVNVTQSNTYEITNLVEQRKRQA